MNWHNHPGVRSGEELTLGERSADFVRNGMGSWGFIWLQTVVIIIWVSFTSFGIHLDPFPFILLNLIFSTQAAYASPIILLSQKRADKQASELAMHVYKIDQETLDHIIKSRKENTEIIKLLQTILSVIRMEDR